MISLILGQCCSPSHALQTGVIVIVMLFILFGGVIFQALETDHAGTAVEGEKKKFLICVEQQLSFSKNYYNKEMTMASIIAENCFRSRHGQWSFADSVLFAFGIVTTIGYGKVFPHTNYGKIFCCFYALIGIPLTMIAIANIGKYLSLFLQRIELIVEAIFKTSFFAPFRTVLRCFSRCFGSKSRLEEEAKNDKISGKTFIIVFLVYIACGSYAISWWEPELTAYSTAVYFNLLSLTSAGLGDYSPESGAYLLLTMLYLTIGLAITSISLDLGSDYLRKLHYYREKIGNVRNVLIRLGSKKVSVGRFLTVICDHLGVNKELIDNLDLDNIMQHEMDRMDDPNNNDSVHSKQNIEAFDPEITDCNDAEIMSLLSDCKQQFAKSEITGGSDAEIMSLLSDCKQQFAKSEITEMQNLTPTLEISCKMIQEELKKQLFPQTELAVTELIDFQDLSPEFAMIPFKEEEYLEFYDRHRNAIRKASKLIPGRRDYKYDPKKAHEIYRKEWERIEQVKKKNAEDLAKKRRQRAVESWKKINPKK